MACGDTSGQWVPLLGSVFSGMITDSDTSVVAVFAQTDNVAATLVGGVPLVGVWQFQDGSLAWTAQTEGISYSFQVSPSTCASGKVTVADGGVGDSFNVGHPFTMSRVL
jgi:hypothetical protein